MFDGRNYFRHTLIALARWNKPVIISGRYAHPKSYRWKHGTFLDIHPFAYIEGKKVETECLCDHVNINYDDLLMYYRFTRMNNNEKFFLICLPSVYKDADGYERGGMVLTERIFPIPVIPATQEEWLRTIPVEMYVDFTRVFEGRYAWEKGHRKWKNGHMAKEPQKPTTKRKKKAAQPDAFEMPYTSKQLIIPECPLNLPRKTGAAISVLSHRLANDKYKGMANSNEAALLDILDSKNI